MCYSTSEHCAWLSMPKCFRWHGFTSMERFQLKEKEQKVNHFGSWIQGSGILAEFMEYFSKSWWGKLQNWVGCGREISKQYATTEIVDSSSLFWSGSRFKEKDVWDPGTCLPLSVLWHAVLIKFGRHGLVLQVWSHLSAWFVLAIQYSLKWVGIITANRIRNFGIPKLS